MLFKLLTFGLIFLLIIRMLGRMFIKPFIQGARPNGPEQRRQQARPKDGNVDVNFSTKKTKDKSTQNYKGGDYVDFEEVD